MGRNKIQAPPEREVIVPKSWRVVVYSLAYILTGAALISGGVCFSVFQIEDRWATALMIIVGVATIILYFPWLISVFGNKINIGTRAVIAQERYGRIAFPRTVCYYEICDIQLVKKVGKNKSITMDDETIITRPCIIFDCINGDKKTINTFFYSEKQIIKILDMILERAAQNDNKLKYLSGQEIYDSALTA